MKAFRIVFTCFIFMAPLRIFAADVTITSTPYTSDVNMFMLSDFNFSGRGTSASELFFLTLTNLTPEPQQCELLLEIVAEVQGLLASGHTDPFTLEGNEQIVVTNRNLFNQAQQFTLQDYKIEDVGDELTALLLATGRLPADTYIFRFQLVDANGALLGETEIRFVITNPSTIDLVSPGVVANDADAGEVYMPFPLFRWESEITSFKLTIAEQLSDAQDDQSPEEIIQQRIVFEQKLVVSKTMSATGTDGALVIPSTLFQYPVGGARPLEEGKTYYWQIIGLVKTSGEPLEIPSEIWKFRITGGGAQMLTPLQQQILNLVGEMDESLLKPGGDLYQSVPTELVTKNGVVLKEEAILNLLAKIVNGDYEVFDVSVE